MKTFKSFTTKDKTRILEMFKEGKSGNAISKSEDLAREGVYRVLRSYGLTLDSYAKMEKHGNWKGGRSVNKDGYIFVRIQPDDQMFSMSYNGYIAEHRLVMARSLNRTLTSKETVHHINGDKEDNRMENLQLMQGTHVRGTCYRCGDCGSLNVITKEIAA